MVYVELSVSWAHLVIGTIQQDHKILVQLQFYSLVFYFSLGGGVMQGNFAVWSGASSIAVQYFVVWCNLHFPRSNSLTTGTAWHCSARCVPKHLEEFLDFRIGIEKLQYNVVLTISAKILCACDDCDVVEQQQQNKDSKLNSFFVKRSGGFNF